MRPRIEESEIIRTRVGLRPYRPSGFVVRGEAMGDKWIVHNYGHGGAGITLSWGSSTLAMGLVSNYPDRRAAVLGCGVMGLTSARLLQQRGWQVTIYAKDLPPNTTSNVAGGFWAPTSVFGKHVDLDIRFVSQLSDAVQISHAAFTDLLGKGYGVSRIENYFLSNNPISADDYYFLHDWPELFPGINVLAPDQHPFAAPYVLSHMTLLIEPAIFLPRLMDDFRAAGGRIVVREMRAREELLTLEEPLILNCTGLGAKALFDDEELTPVRGQLVFVPPDERVDYCMHGNGRGSLYMFPRVDGILLGGSFERGATHLEPDAETTARIISEHARIVAAMRV